MSKKRQTPVYDPRGRKASELTTLSYDYRSGHRIPEHFHPEHQLVFASEGVMTIQTGSEQWLVPPLRAVWIPGGVAHSIQMSGRVSMRTLYFAPRLRTRMPRACTVLHVSALFRELVLHICGFQALRMRVPAEKHLIELVVDLLGTARAIPLRLPQPTDERAARLTAILLANPGDPRTLAKLSRACGASKRTIERIFAQEAGMTFGKWRQQLRLLHAIRLLGSGESVTTAAFETGYNSPSAFISAFKKSYGVTPRAYLELS